MLLAQISDIHAEQGSESIEALRRALDWLEKIRPAALIVSGDLANPPHERGYAMVAEALARVPWPIFIVPGNVDDHEGLRRAFPDHDYWHASGPMRYSVDLGEVRLLGFDVTVAGEDHGDARPGLPWLSAELASGSRTPALIVTHQHLFDTGIARKDINKCRNSEAVADLVAGAPDPVIGFTCGHVHRAMFTRFAGRPATMCPSLTRANRLRIGGGEPEITDPPGLLVHDVSEGRILTHVVSLG